MSFSAWDMAEQNNWVQLEFAMYDSVNETVPWQSRSKKKVAFAGLEEEEEIVDDLVGGEKKGELVCHGFKKLPIEIRNMIWGCAGPKSGYCIKQATPITYTQRFTITYPRPTPAVFHVCRESRAEWMYCTIKPARQKHVVDMLCTHPISQARRVNSILYHSKLILSNSSRQDFLILLPKTPSKTSHSDQSINPVLHSWHTLIPLLFATSEG